MSLSGWCHPDLPHPAAHQACQQRIDDGLLDGCDCTKYGGHRITSPTPLQAQGPPGAPMEVAS